MQLGFQGKGALTDAPAIDQHIDVTINAEGFCGLIGQQGRIFKVDRQHMDVYRAFAGTFNPVQFIAVARGDDEFSPCIAIGINQCLANA
ncbi:hypothetical protein D3C86_1219480 [compost metagenome]